MSKLSPSSQNKWHRHKDIHKACVRGKKPRQIANMLYDGAALAPKARAKHLVARNMLQTTWRLLDAHQLIYMIFRNTTGVEHFNTLAMHPLA